MKKRLFTLFLSLTLCLGLLPAASAASEDVTVVLKLESNQMSVNGTVQQVDEGNAAIVPILEEARTLVPVSRIVAAFGGESGWDGDTLSATFSLNGHKVAAQIGSKLIKVDGRSVTMDIPARLIQARTYVPLRAVLEGLGLWVGYEPTQQLVVASTRSLDRQDLLALSQSQALLISLERVKVPASNYTSGLCIAPARSKATMEPSHTDAVYVQDISPATGFFFTYENQNYDYNNYLIYNPPASATDREIVNELAAYADLLAAQPDFELVRLSSPADASAFYADLNYTGSAVRMKGNLQSNEGKTVHISIGWTNWWNREATVGLDDSLSYADLGLRTSGGAWLAAEQVSGERVGEAYYLDKGTYYNSGDKKLSTTSGKAALLIDGKSYTGTASFTTSSKDKLTISGYYRSDSIEISLPLDWTMTGDVYGLDDLRYGYQESTWGPFLKVAYGSNQWATPLADPDQQITEATVRVLKWDKSGDTVLYFHAKAEIAGKLYDIEGLAAAPWTDPKGNRPGSSGEGDCWYCGGSGDCPTCGGTGRVSNWLPGTTHTFLDQNCTDCYSPGKCRICGGSGEQ